MKYLLLFLLLFSSQAFAKDEEEGDRKVVYRQKTEIDFEGLEIEAVLQKPQSALVIERRSASFNPLIKLRTDFNDKIEEDIEKIK